MNQKLLTKFLKFVIPIVILLICVLIVFVLSEVLRKNSPDAARFYSEKGALNEENRKEMEVYSNIIKNDNPKAALFQLRSDIASNHSLAGDCHSIVHEIGHQAYIKYRSFNESMEYQDGLCNSGYLHGVIEAHFKQTNDILTEMKTLCNGNPAEKYEGWQCIHGIGHGLMYYLNNNVEESIGYCETYENLFEREVCVNGVLMENFNSNPKLHPAKFLKKDNPFYLCEKLKSDYKKWCFYFAPTYILSMNESNYNVLWEWCKKAPLAYQPACSSGSGSKVFEENPNNPLLVESFCMSDENPHHNSCISGMTSFKLNNTGSPEETFKMCEILTDKNKNICRQVVFSRQTEFN